MTAALKIDKFNIEKNIKLCASVIFYFRDDIELIPITLKDIGELKVCTCSNETVVNQRNECTGCRGEEYEKEAIKQGIRELRID